ncbi:ATPase [Acidocella aquatica]|uniref:ATPase n=1 Tax=Acidocella aquatica TaxID=1922313 RepID=A0ABQ6A4D8_9PROT|nr:ATP12 family protein [Acidocella aquatica]GLR66193.1 ATPase [Acidocella aquatica]
MKRFWAATSAVPEGSDFAIRLDSRPLKLPSGRALTVPFEPLAAAIATEWATVGTNFTPDDLPLTRLATTAQDRVRLHRAEIAGQLAAYGMNDLLCYRAEGPPGLARREAEEWDPWIGWLDQRLGIRLKSTSGVMPLQQAPEYRDTFTTCLMQMDEYQLAGLGVIVPALGSLVLALAVEAGALDPDTACRCAGLGELWQETHWGMDAEAAARRRIIAEDVAVSACFMVLCRA